MFFSSRPAEAQEADGSIRSVEEDASDLAPPPSTWRGATDSLHFLLLEHSTRVAFQGKTRRELGGPFFKGYRRSLRVPATWEDGDGWAVNYVGRASRGRATAWAAGYSLQFEFGPFSEASIGNVGLRPNTTGWVDHVVTPAGALGFMVAEDALDRYLILRIERWTSNRFLRAAARTGQCDRSTKRGALSDRDHI